MRKLLLLYICLILWFAVGENKPTGGETGTKIEKAEKSRLVLMKITAYDPNCRICVGKWRHQRKTATGRDAIKHMDGVAADFCLLSPKTKLFVPILKQPHRVVDDTGGKMRADGKIGIYHIDIRMPTHKEAKRFGVRWAFVTVLEE